MWNFLRNDSMKRSRSPIKWRRPLSGRQRPQSPSLKTSWLSAQRKTDNKGKDIIQSEFHINTLQVISDKHQKPNDLIYIKDRKKKAIGLRVQVTFQKDTSCTKITKQEKEAKELLQSEGDRLKKYIETLDQRILGFAKVKKKLERVKSGVLKTLLNLTNIFLNKAEEGKYASRMSLSMSEDLNIEYILQEMHVAVEHIDSVIRDIEAKKSDEAITTLKAKIYLRQTKCVIKALQDNLKDSQNDCNKFLNDWNKYKSDVKIMMGAKNSIIKRLKEEINNKQNTADLIYTNIVERKRTVELEKDDILKALQEERLAKIKIKDECNYLHKVIQTITQESNKDITQLRFELQEKVEIIKIIEQQSDKSPTISNQFHARGDNLMNTDFNERTVLTLWSYLTQVILQAINKNPNDVSSNARCK